MIWSYNDEYRDEFSLGPHRDILIVPHATKVTPVPGGPPIITSRRPIFDWNPNTNKYEPRKSGDDFVLDDVEWTITNDDIVKEKFKYTYSLNSEQNLTFSSCNSAMMQFTIRNKKEYVEEQYDEDAIRYELTKLGEGGNVNLNKRPEISVQELIDAGWNSSEVGEGYATVFSRTFCNSAQTIYGNFTPIVDNPTTGAYIRCMGPDEFTAYCEGVMDETRTDTDNIKIGSNFTGEYALDNAEAAAIRIHDLHEELHELHEGHGTGNWYWEQEIPNLYKKEYTKKDPDGTERIVTGEVLSHACIELYMYINGDSSTIQYMGMFTVEEDKLVDGGYNRQITAYDFLATFRDMDIFNWYKHLFIGINKYDNDLEDATSDSKEETTKPDDYDDKDNWVREKREKWTIGDAIKDLFTNIAAYDMAVFEEDENGNKVMIKGATDGNPNDYGRDGYPEGNRYSGFGMPIKLDPDLFDKTKKYDIPTETGDDKKECYGYMDILELEFYQNPKIMKAESLSFGKFLEDVGMLAGRYPYIRLDDLEENDYFDPNDQSHEGDHKYDSRYNNYERCILTFKPLPSSDRDSTVAKTPEMEFSNHELAKGFQHEYWPTENIAIFKIPLDDGTEITYKRLDKEQQVAESKSLLQTFTMPNNMFASYLVTKSDDDEVKKMLDKYKVIREDLFGKETKNGNMSAGAKFQPGYLNMLSRTYTPFQLTTYCDFVRECGDRILINFNDKVTGEITTFYSYILEREISGVQKMMDTYTANGSVRNPIFANYQASLKSGSENQNKGKDLGLMTPFDLIEYMRNCGYRLLDEPTDCEAKFCKGGESGDPSAEHYFYNCSYFPDEEPADTFLKDGDTVNPIISRGTEVTVNPGDYVDGNVYSHLPNDHEKDPVVPSFIDNPLYVYTLNGDWKYVGMANFGEGCSIFDGSSSDITLDEGDGNFYVGSTCNRIIVKPSTHSPFTDYYYIEDYDGTGGYKYYGREPEKWGISSPTEVHHTEPLTVTVNYGDAAKFIEHEVYVPGESGEYIYQYPGVWVHTYDYPKLDVPVAKTVKPYVQLKWTDPPDITDWQPTPATWEGTVIIRKEDSAPLHRWDGEKVVNVTTRDKYKTKAYKDKDIKLNKTYYYCFMPYYTIDNSDPEHPIRAYTFTKTIKVETGDKSTSSTINKIDVSGNTATIHYTLSKPDVGQFTNIKIYGKIGSNPACDNTDDIVVDVDDFNSSSKSISNLEYDVTYYFCLVTVDTNDEKLTSNVESCQIENPIPVNLRPYVKLINDTTGYTYDSMASFSMYNYIMPKDGSNPDFVQECIKYTWSNYTYTEQASIRQYPPIVGSNNESQTVKCCDKLTLQVDSSTFTITSNEVSYYLPWGGGRYRYYSGAYFHGYPASSVSGNVNSYSMQYVSQGYKFSTSSVNKQCNSLEYCIKWIAWNFRNATLYVDGVLWTKANNEN